MNPSITEIFAVVVLVISSTGLLVARDWRWGIGLLGFQYFGVFFLVSLSWSVELATVKLVAGWIAASVLALSRLQTSEAEGQELNYSTSRLFRIFITLPLIITAYSITQFLGTAIPNILFSQFFGGLVLIFMGLLKISLTSRPLRGMFGLLTMLSGFEIIYAVVEHSDLVAGLLATVTLALSLCGAYIITVADLKEEDTL